MTVRRGALALGPLLASSTSRRGVMGGSLPDVPMVAPPLAAMCRCRRGADTAVGGYRKWVAPCPPARTASSQRSYQLRGTGHADPACHTRGRAPANPLWNQARGAAPRRVHYPPHPVGVKGGREASMDDRDDGTAPATDPFSPDPSGGFERGADDRRRLEHQFGLLREDFNLWFDGMLRLGGLSIDPDRATWSVLDVGCGEGLFTREIARRYPNAHVVGIDVDADAVAAAMARGADVPSVRFLAHDVR